ncbi:MAG TPA: hypothetical protein VF584_14740 [Longimicrobium sp.]|jgi:hypothetical protein
MKVAIRLLMLAVGVVLAMDVLYLVNGSLEMFPTEEQQEKIRVVTGAIAVLLLCAEAGLWTLLRRTPPRAAPLIERSVP